MGEIKRHPYTTVTALGLFVVCLFALPFLFINKADAGDVQALARQISEVRETVKREATLGELRGVERELFEIQFRITTLERENQAVDVLLYRRRDELVGQQRRLEATLQEMDKKQ